MKIHIIKSKKFDIIFFIHLTNQNNSTRIKYFNIIILILNIISAYIEKLKQTRH